MPRPCKQRRVCAAPCGKQFGPMGDTAQLPRVMLNVEEYEAIRLMDLEGLTQEDCAVRLDVKRTTVQAIYASARQKLAAALVHGWLLEVGGGSYVVCSGHGACACAPGCPRPNDAASTGMKEEAIMKIAIPYENGQVFQHFGHTEQFKVYEAQDGKIVHSEVVSTNGSGHGALAALLSGMKVDALICGGIGGGAQQALTAADIRFFGGVTGDADAAAASLAAGQLTYDPNAKCNHHDHHEGSCGEHGCGSHSCGSH